MALPYRKWTEEQIKSRNVFPAGEYPFTITEALLTKTRGGLDNKGQPKNVYPMLQLSLELHDANGQVKKMKDWIVFMEGMDWKLRHLADTTKLMELYDNDALTEAHLVRKSGVLCLGSRESEYNGEKRIENFVKDYGSKASPATPANQPFMDDDIPM